MAEDAWKGFAPTQQAMSSGLQLMPSHSRTLDDPPRPSVELGELPSAFRRNSWQPDPSLRQVAQPRWIDSSQDGQTGGHSNAVPPQPSSTSSDSPAVHFNMEEAPPEPPFLHWTLEGGWKRWWLRLRYKCWKIASSFEFSMVVVAIIFLNCITLALYVPTMPRGNNWNLVLSYLDTAFTVLFTIEMGIRLMALGFKLYISEVWNWLDIIVVIGGYASIIQMMVGETEFNLSAIRTVRVLRPLRAIPMFPGLRVLVSAILKSIPLMGSVVLLCIYAFLLFSILGMELFMGALRRRCVLEGQYIMVEISGADTCENRHNNTPTGELCRTLDDDTCAASSPIKFWGPRFCPESYDCVPVENPNYGFTSFDNIASSLLAVFQSVTLEGWVDIMYWLMDSTAGWSCFFSITLVILGSFLLVNLLLAVITVIYSQVSSSDKDHQAQIAEALEDEAEIGSIAGNRSEPDPMAVVWGSLLSPEQLSKLKTDNKDVNAGTRSHKNLTHWMTSETSSPTKLQRQISKSCPRFSHEDVERSYDNAHDPAEERRNGWSGGEGTPTLSQKSNGRANTLEGGEVSRTPLTGVKSWVHNLYGRKTAVPPEDQQEEFGHESHSHQSERGSDGASGACTALRMFFFRMLVSSWFNPLITALILINTVVLAMEYYGQSQLYGLVLTTINYVLAVAFIVEMFIKMLALGFSQYFRDRFNLFDLVVNCLTVVQVVLNFTTDSSSSSFSALRAFRILRVLRIFSHWPALQTFLNTVVVTIRELGNFCVIVFLTAFIYALVGVQLFGGTYTEDVFPDGIPRQNFDNILWAFLTVFQVLTGEDWPYLMYDGMRAVGDWASIYFISLVVIGNFFIMNLFIAILLSNFAIYSEQDEEGEMAEQEVRLMALRDKIWKSASKVASGAKTVILSRARSITESAAPLSQVPDGSGALTKRRFSLRGWGSNASSLPTLSGPLDPESAVIAKRRWALVRANLKSIAAGKLHKHRPAKRPPRKAVGVRTKLQERMAAAQMTNEEAFEEARMQIIAEQQALVPVVEEDKDQKSHAAPKPLAEYTTNSLCCLAPTNGFRRWVFNIMDKPAVDMFILLLIVISSLAMATESPWTTTFPVYVEIMFWIDIVFTVIFLLEMMAKIVAFGLIGEDGTYLKDPWNVFDGIIVVISIINLALDIQTVVEGANGTNQLSVLKSLRVVRVLRPLRVIHRVPELKVVVNVLIQSFPGMGMCMLVSMVCFLIFGILGMNFFLGMFYSCNDTSVISKGECVGTFMVDGEEMHRLWENAPANFDNVFNAMLTLFEMSTTEGWVEVMHDGMDAVGLDMQPQMNYGSWRAVYFVAFMIMGAFFLINLFIGIIMEQFSSVKESQGGQFFATAEQEKWIMVQNKILKLKVYKTPARPTGVRGRVFGVVTSTWFELVIMVFILMNVMVMCSQYYAMSEYHEMVVAYFNLAFGVVFALEAIFKIYALGFRQYFTDGWNLFDFTIVIASIVGLMLEFLFSLPASGLSILRVIRVMRALRLLRFLTSLRIMFETLMISLPVFINVGAMMFLIMFIYSILGVSLFGYVNQETGRCLNRHANFSNFGVAMLTLFRMMTGEAWNCIMHDAMVQPPHCCESSTPPDQCHPNTVPGDCGYMWAPVYFVSFLVLGGFIILNLFLAVILDNYSKEIEDEKLIHDEDMQKLIDLWKKYDTEGTGFMKVTAVASMLRELPPPLGLAPTPAEMLQGGSRLTRVAALRFMGELNISITDMPLSEQVVFYQDLLFSLVAFAHDIKVEDVPVHLREQIGKKISDLRYVKGKTHVSRAYNSLCQESEDDPVDPGVSQKSLLKAGAMKIRNNKANWKRIKKDLKANLSKGACSTDTDNSESTAKYNVEHLAAATIFQQKARSIIIRREMTEYILLKKTMEEVQQMQRTAMTLHQSLVPRSSDPEGVQAHLREKLRSADEAIALTTAASQAPTPAGTEMAAQTPRTHRTWKSQLSG